METYIVQLEGIDTECFEYNSFEEAIEGMKRLRDSSQKQFEEDRVSRTLLLTIEVS